MRPYFAYGSNLWRKQMQARCPEHRFLGTGVLTGFRWIITTQGYASLVKSGSDLVLGVVYAISEADEQRLDHCEGVLEGAYLKLQLPVQTGRGMMDCLVYQAALEQEGDPREEYAERIRYGIRDAGLPSLYVERYLDKIVSWQEPYAHAG
jgi:gamma-glutamylcyclotransferase